MVHNTSAALSTLLSTDLVLFTNKNKHVCKANKCVPMVHHMMSHVIIMVRWKSLIHHSVKTHLLAVILRHYSQSWHEKPRGNMGLPGPGKTSLFVQIEISMYFTHKPFSEIQKHVGDMKLNHVATISVIAWYIYSPVFCFALKNVTSIICESQTKIIKSKLWIYYRINKQHDIVGFSLLHRS